MNKAMTMDNEMNNERIHQAYDCYLRLGTPSDALTIDTKVTGGYLLPADFETKLLDAVSNTGVLRSLCTEITTERDTFLPIVTGCGKPAWVPDGGALPLVRDQFDRVLLHPHTLAATIRVTQELLKDSAVDIEKYLADTFAQRLTETEEEAFITGDGLNKPTGLIQQAAVGCETQTAGTITLDDVLNLIFSVPEKYRRNSVLLMNDTILLHLYRLCAAQGTSLWFGKTNDGKDDTFFGMRIVRCAAMPDMESGNIPILFGNFRQVFISDCGRRSMKRLKELFALNDHIGFVIGERVDIRLIVRDAIKGLKVS